MFSQASVILFTGGKMSLPVWFHVLSREGMMSLPAWSHVPSVGILLEEGSPLREGLSREPT